jgi:hypothetical protein
MRWLIEYVADEIKPANIVFKLYVTETLQLLLQQEDTDNNVQITVLDNGPKVGFLSLEIKILTLMSSR